MLATANNGLVELWVGKEAELNTEDIYIVLRGCGLELWLGIVKSQLHKGWEEVVELMIDNGADPKVKEIFDFGESKNLWVVLVNYISSAESGRCLSKPLAFK